MSAQQPKQKSAVDFFMTIAQFLADGLASMKIEKGFANECFRQAQYLCQLDAQTVGDNWVVNNTLPGLVGSFEFRDMLPSLLAATAATDDTEEDDEKVKEPSLVAFVLHSAAKARTEEELGKVVSGALYNNGKLRALRWALGQVVVDDVSSVRFDEDYFYNFAEFLDNNVPAVRKEYQFRQLCRYGRYESAKTFESEMGFHLKTKAPVSSRDRIQQSAPPPPPTNDIRNMLANRVGSPPVSPAVVPPAAPKANITSGLTLPSQLTAPAKVTDEPTQSVDTRSIAIRLLSAGQIDPALGGSWVATGQPPDISIGTALLGAGAITPTEFQAIWS